MAMDSHLIEESNEVRWYVGGLFGGGLRPRGGWDLSCAWLGGLLHGLFYGELVVAGQGA